MAWNQKYWDTIDQLYWWPRYLGLQSISQKNWKIEGDRISIPAAMVNRSGPLYSRSLKVSELIDDLHSKEEILNHVFDLTFAIGPDTLISRALLGPLGFGDSGPFQSIGREAQDRYGWGPNANVTQHDGLFVSEKSVVAVELKLASSSWPEQVLKYAALLAWEELATGTRLNLGLLFIVPEQAKASHWSKCGLVSNQVDSGFLNQTWSKPLPQALQAFLSRHHNEVASVLDRLVLKVISWRELRSDLSGLEKGLDRSQAGEQTLAKLLDGFIAQLDAHRGTGL